MSGSVAERLATLFGLAAGGVTTAYLFGSAAREELRADSDIDVGVPLAEGVAGTDACLAIEERVERALGRRAQVVDLSRAPADLVQRVLRDGVLLLDRDPRSASGSRSVAATSGTTSSRCCASIGARGERRDRSRPASEKARPHRGLRRGSASARQTGGGPGSSRRVLCPR